MTRLEVIDLDNVADIDRLWHELKRAHELRTADPELRHNIEKAITVALDRGAITEEQATEIDLMLESCVPGAVLEAWWKELIPNLDRATIGAFPRRECEPAPNLDQWFRDDPTRLRGVMHEASRFTNDLKRIAAVALDIADKLGIPEDVADQIVADELHALNREHRQVTSNGK